MYTSCHKCPKIHSTKARNFYGKEKTGEAYLQFTVDTDVSIVDTYTQFKYDGEDTIQDLPDDARKSLILNPFIEYGNNNGKPFTEEEQYALYGESYDPSEDSEE